MPAPQVHAKFTHDGTSFDVQFNPMSLQLTIANTLDQGQGKAPKQFVKDSKAQLALELCFDTTDDGSNVCVKTDRVSKLMAPSGKDKVPPTVAFEWGAFKFSGIIDSYKETIDFFSSNGVPLRSTVSLSMSQQEQVFDSTPDAAARAAPDAAIDVPTGLGQSTADVASQGGNPDAARSIASTNGEESMRFPANASLTLDPSASLGPPVAFASGGVSIGVSGGASIGMSAGFGADAALGAIAALSATAMLGAGAGASRGGGLTGGTSFTGGTSLAPGATLAASAAVSAGATVSATTGPATGGRAGTVASPGSSAAAGFGQKFSPNSFVTGTSAFATLGVAAPMPQVGVAIRLSAGGAASAGLPSSMGAFGLLRSPALGNAPTGIRTDRFVQRVETFSYTTGEGATFEIGGRARLQSSAGISADVGASTSRRGRIRFEED